MARRRSRRSPRRWLIPALATVLLMVAAAVFLVRHTPLGPRIVATVKDLITGGEPPCCSAEIVLAHHNMPVVAIAVNDIWQEGKARRLSFPERMRTPAQAIYVALMADGDVLADMWMRQGNVLEAVTAGINELKRGLPVEEQNSVDTIALFLGHSLRDVDATDVERDVLGKRHRGIRGYEILYDKRSELVSPLQTLRANINMEQLVDRFARNHQLEAQTVTADGTFRILDGEQIIVRLGDVPRAVLMERGNDYVSITDVSAERLREAVALATDWMAAHVGTDGAMDYGYRPSTRDTLPGNNLVRQWLGTVALGRAAIQRYDFEFWALAERNLDHNLAAYYRQEGDNGVVYMNRDQVPLGAQALAAMAIRASSSRTRLADKAEALDRTVLALWQPDGGFRTFLRPADRNDNQNFYPGEALVYWAERYARDGDPALLDRFMKSFDYYRSWYGEHPNPAFIGWHTQADYIVWQITKDDALRDFVFKINDDLLTIQQWGLSNQYRDMMGRFYLEGGSIGPPHASSTGIYLEGLIDAFSLARDAGDEKRAEAYRIAILRGLRSVLQLQFQDDTDMFYVPSGFRKYVRGGIRTTVYDNTIRMDNVQHNLMAMLKVLRAFGPDDYIYPADAN